VVSREVPFGKAPRGVWESRWEVLLIYSICFVTSKKEIKRVDSFQVMPILVPFKFCLDLLSFFIKIDF
jgi:hypothetical protein